MIVPEYWAEAKIKDTINGHQFTVKRFGWSDESEQDAFDNAQQRADDAMERARKGEKIRKIDHKVSYNGAEGLPIREEIISRHENAVITRNSYGALCINTPDVLFADIDFSIEPSPKLSFGVFFILIALSTFAGWYMNSWGVAIGASITACFIASSIASKAHKHRTKNNDEVENRALNKVQGFVEKNPNWNLRVYRTPMGYRILAMHKTFSPNDQDALEFLQEIDSDPLYVQMCKNQNCFRARISPKPWRAGVPRLGPRPGIWPIKVERMEGRTQWVNNYNQQTKDYAACRFEVQLGSHVVDSSADYIRELHDRYCKTDSDLPIA